MPKLPALGWWAAAVSILRPQAGSWKGPPAMPPTKNDAPRFLRPRQTGRCKLMPNASPRMRRRVAHQFATVGANFVAINDTNRYNTITLLLQFYRVLLMHGDPSMWRRPQRDLWSVTKLAGC